MIKKVSHIGLAVDNLEEARSFFSENFGLSTSERENFGELIFSFIPMKGTNLELLQSTEPEGQIAKFIQRRGQGIHHISFEVDDIQSELDRLKGRGIKLINEKPYLNAHKDLVAFIHPKSSFGVLIELIQKKESDLNRASGVKASYRGFHTGRKEPKSHD
jgi:methylmalonyl-CoA epimerase